ncbi:hypothetical protein VB618_11095 [Microvirga sp. CF3062]|uniref:hypothetical protein n=1 Tax=Microvirga sp. CF3062 TaxID=3110182 RepID=UPI002E79AB2C|nr:hypothetical protein [Microvirga sp. CF3062]MEE1656745.1 hypothetical protein [Microvirga sp. CF3062]
MTTVWWVIVGVCALSLFGGLLGIVRGSSAGEPFTLVLFGALGLAAVGYFTWGWESAPPQPKDPAVEACRQDFRKCTTQDQLVDTYQGMREAHTTCKQAARKLARFGDADLPFYAFETYFPIEKSFATGQISLVETEAKYQNAYGAMQRVRVKCVYDLTNKTVVEVNAAPQ